MASTTPNSAYLRGVIDGLPFLVVLLPFAALFGLVATEAGLSVFETLVFSVLVIAGAAQFTAIQLFQENAPTLVVLISALAVNLRMAMYSASLTPYIGAAPLWQRAFAAYLIVDQSYVVSIAEYERRPDMTVPQRMAYFFGAVTPVAPLWYIFSVIGAYLGERIPESLALDFAVPITFLAMITPMLRTVAHVAAALTAIIVSLLAAGLPYSLGVIVAGFLAILVGAQVELWVSRSKGAGS